MSKLSVSRVALAVLVVAMMPTLVNAVTYDKLAYLTFNGPVQVPGVTLNAGTYGFKLANPNTGRNVLQVVSNDGAIVYATFHTLPDIRTTVTSEAIVSFRETPAGVPAAVKSLFYGGEHAGYEFVYAKGDLNIESEIHPQPAITYTRMPAAANPVANDKPEFEIFVEPLEFQQVASTPLNREELPRTATPLPLIATGGLTSLLVGLGIGILRRRHN